MRRRTSAFIFAVALFVSPALAHELGSGDRYFSFDGNTYFVETNEILVSIGSVGGYPDDTPHYQVSITSKLTDARNTVNFPMEGGRMPRLVTFSNEHYCGQQVILVTMQNEGPRYADVLGYTLETHAFLSQTLDYLDTVFAPVTDIAPLESGVDIGFPYLQPQPYIVDCRAGEGGFELTFRENDRRGD